jgi:hypothetical protein
MTQPLLTSTEIASFTKSECINAELLFLKNIRGGLFKPDLFRIFVEGKFVLFYCFSIRAYFGSVSVYKMSSSHSKILEKNGVNIVLYLDDGLGMATNKLV